VPSRDRADIPLSVKRLEGALVDLILFLDDPPRRFPREHLRKLDAE